MSDSSKSEAQVIQAQLHKARRAAVPNLAEVRKCREKFYEIRRFENASRKVFGNVAEPCTTAWND